MQFNILTLQETLLVKRLCATHQFVNFTLLLMTVNAPKLDVKDGHQHGQSN